VFEYVAGAAGALDPYSAFLSTGKLNEVYSQIEGNFVGLGVELKASDGSLLIVKVFAGGPADRGLSIGEFASSISTYTMSGGLLNITNANGNALYVGQNGTSAAKQVPRAGVPRGGSERALRTVHR